VKASTALRLIRELAVLGRVEITAHALEEALQEGAFRHDILHVLQHPQEVVLEDESRSRWKVYGYTLDDTDLAVVTLILQKNTLRIITVHPPP
jgi:uncharacterized DUF497 family protein